jgi:hypothetical protein
MESIYRVLLEDILKCVNLSPGLVGTSKIYFQHLVFEGVEEYSCKVFTVKRAISKKEESVDGPLVQYLLLQVSVWH